MSRSEIIVHIIRGSIVESKHRGHIAAVDAQGCLHYYLGQHTCFVYARSTAKPLQAIPVVETGAAKKSGLSMKEIALLCASHSGEPEHTDAARSILEKSGFTPDDLACGAHEPFHQPTAAALRRQGKMPTPLHNNCSGKHAGMLTLAAFQNVPSFRYFSPDHPVQQQMLQVVADMCGLPEEDVALGIDGCGVPVFGMPLNRLAYAFARLGKPAGLAPSRSEAIGIIMEAVRNNPRYIAGTDRFDTRLIEVTKGRIIGKMGAEGVYALTIPEHGLGMALKVEDGAERALYPAVVEALAQMHQLNETEQEELKRFHTPALKNWQEKEVGRIVPSFRLQRP